MSSITEELADRLAQDVIAAAEDLGDDNLIMDIGKVIAASSTTTQEAYMTAIRVRLSEARARKALAERIAAGPRPGARRGLSEGRILDAADEGNMGGH